MSISSVDGLLAILGESGLTRPAAERLLQETEGSVETAVALYFSSDRSRIVQEEPASPLTQLQAILGTSVTNHQAEELLARANNSVQEAVDLYYTTGGGASPGSGTSSEAEDAAAGPASAAGANNSTPGHGPGTGRRRARPTRRSAGRPPTRFAEAAAGEGPGDDDDDSDDDEDDDAADVMSLDESEDPSVLAVTEGEQEVMDGEPEAPEQEPGESVRWYLSRRQQQEMRDLSNRPQMSVLLRLKEEARKESKKLRCLPFPKQRDAHGRLFAALPNRVPPVMAPSKPLWFPLRLGSLDVDLELQDAETDGPIAVDVLEGKRKLLEDQFTFKEHGSNTWVLQQAVTGEAKDEKLSCVTKLLDFKLFSTLDSFEDTEEIEVLYELRVESKSGEAKKPKKKKNKAKQLNVQVKLRAQVLLKESAISKDVLQATEQKNKRNKWQNMCMYALILQLLQRGCELTLGPDSDGLLNFCDPVDSQTPEQTDMEADKPQAQDKGKQRAEEPLEEPEDSSEVEEVQRPKWQTDIEKLLTSGMLPKDADLDPVPAQLQSHPKRFQLQGLRWMVTRERNGDAVGRGHLHLHPAWLQLLTADGQLIYVHLMPPHQITADFITAPTGGTCGGFLCDMMGLGKTLETLMLLLANPAPPNWAVAEMDGHSRASDADPVPIKTTLIVMPANLLGQWQEELQLHVKPGALTWGVYQGQEASLSMRRQESHSSGLDARVSGRPRTKMNPGSNTWTHMVTQLFCQGPDGQPLPLHTCDVAFMSYENLRKELGYAGKSLLLQFGFWRLVLDEAQLVAASSSVAALMTSALWRRHAWVVTGTPITSRVEEIQGLLEFLAYEPFYDNRSWSSLVLRRHETGPERLLPLCSLLKGVMLRRTKEDVEGELELLPCTHEDVWVQLSSVERAMYERTRDAVESGLRYSGVKRRGNASSSAHKKVPAKVVGQFTQLRQQCCHPQIVRRDVWLGKTRLSMRQILTRLVTRAFGEYDSALRAEYNARLLLAAVQHEHELCRANAGGDAFELVLRRIELGMDLSAATDLQQLLGSRDSEGALPPPDLSTPHPFRGSGPGAIPGAEQDERGLKRKAHEAAGPSNGGSADGGPAQEPAPSSLPNGGLDVQMAADGPGPEDKGKGRAVEEDEAGPEESAAALQPAPDSEAAQAAKAARDRVRLWQRLRLEGLALLVDVLETCKDALGRKRSKKPDDAADAEARLVAIRDDLQQVRHAAESLRMVLGDEEDEAAALSAAMRFSRRQRKMEVDEDLAADQAVEMQEERAAQQRSTQQMLRAYSHLRARAHPIKAAEKGVATAAEATTERWHALQHLVHKLHSLEASKEQPAAADPDQPGPSSGAGPSTDPAEAEVDDIGSCPICLDVCERRTVTSCGHHFCSDCIHESVHNRAECPICRAPLRPEDLFDAATEEEEENARLHNENVGQYGAKVTALLTQLAEMRSADPTAKAVVFSAWGRLLKLVGGALTANGLQHVSLAGAQPQARADALKRFIHDPDCAVILIVLSTGGGAAGLTLTVANTVFLMEPALNPGLEAQAAARIYRLGQTKATRVVRLLAEGTIEASILKYQQRKLTAGGGSGSGIEEDSLLPQHGVDASTLATLMRDHPPPPTPAK
ncbi:hypothetical protein WJX75_008587 [Coccomyxa subellipsoidea]|uniref:Uncharacterized protein n=1 Tax=Coccomyxa subellipsoidea TaxID=248742 RepID=A0ABR2YU88_9CHLO